jgi:hypothetical protein
MSDSKILKRLNDIWIMSTGAHHGVRLQKVGLSWVVTSIFDSTVFVEHESMDEGSARNSYDLVSKGIESLRKANQ